jgi:hypothetical protein
MRRPLFKSSAAMCVFFVGVIVLSASTLLAQPTQEEVFQSINSSVRSTVDFSKAVPYLVVAAAIIALLVWISHYRQQQATPKKLNHGGKLVREVAKKVGLRPTETKALKILAEEQQVSSPLVLLMCPSLLGKAIRTQNSKVDREVMLEIVRRLRSSDSSQSPPTPPSAH